MNKLVDTAMGLLLWWWVLLVIREIAFKIF